MNTPFQENWPAQLRDSLMTPEQLAGALSVNPREMREVISQYPARLNPYLLSLIRDPLDPIGRQAIPDVRELSDPDGTEDPLDEGRLSPVPGLIHKYPDRVVLLVSNECAVYCRFCNRKGRVGRGLPVNRPAIRAGMEYIRSHREVRDVLLSGGDPLLLSDGELDRILGALRRIPHVEILRIGTRIPSALPQRVTPRLCRVLGRHHPLFISTHFNHPREITPEARRACGLLAQAGIPLGCHTVLLRNVNDDPRVLGELFRGLARLRVRPYYLFQMDLVRGAAHFRTPVSRGLEIMEALWKTDAGFRIPHYVIDLPHGGGKVPLLPSRPGFFRGEEKEVPELTAGVC
jgi:lysine 2,3-aminomutase